MADFAVNGVSGGSNFFSAMNANKQSNGVETAGHVAAAHKNNGGVETAGQVASLFGNIDLSKNPAITPQNFEAIG